MICLLRQNGLRLSALESLWLVVSSWKWMSKYLIISHEISPVSILGGEKGTKVSFWSYLQNGMSNQSRRCRRCSEYGEWRDNSDTSSDEEEYSIPGRLTSEDPIQQAEDATNLDKNSDGLHETTNESTSVSLDETAPTSDFSVISSTSSSTLPATLFNEPVGPAIIMPSIATALNFFQMLHLEST